MGKYTRREFFKLGLSMLAYNLFNHYTFCEEKTQLKMICVGDIMVSKTILGYSYDPIKKEYDFKDCFREVAPYLKQADIVVGNLETRVAGEKLKYTGYPRFNSPDKLVYDLKEAGFNVLITANNHSLDRGEKGVINTNKLLDSLGIINTGTFVSEEDKNNIRVIEKNNIKIAFLAYTKHTNGEIIPKGKEYLVNLIDFNAIERDIKTARTLSPDLLVCYLHFGDEYHLKPNKYQEDTVDFLVDNDVDIICGCHPHVVQPYEIRNNSVIIYSMGNFLSTQLKPYTRIGAMFEFYIEKEETSKTTKIKEVAPKLTFCHKKIINNKKSMVIMPADSLEKIRTDINKEQYKKIKKELQEIAKILELDHSF